MKTVPVRTFYLQLPDGPARELRPPREGIEVVRAEQPSVESYRAWYDAVGSDWNWVDRKLMSDGELGRIIHDELVEIYLLRVEAALAGFAELDRRTEGQIELAYFGLLPGFIGMGLGKYFLNRMVRKARTYRPRRVWLHTCELDHEAALPMYLGAGFELYDEKLIDQVIPPPG